MPRPQANIERNRVANLKDYLNNVLRNVLCTDQGELVDETTVSELIRTVQYILNDLIILQKKEMIERVLSAFTAEECEQLLWSKYDDHNLTLMYVACFIPHHQHLDNHLSSDKSERERGAAGVLKLLLTKCGKQRPVKVSSTCSNNACKRVGVSAEFFAKVWQIANRAEKAVLSSVHELTANGFIDAVRNCNGYDLDNFIGPEIDLDNTTATMEELEQLNRDNLVDTLQGLSDFRNWCCKHYRDAPFDAMDEQTVRLVEEVGFAPQPNTIGDSAEDNLRLMMACNNVIELFTQLTVTDHVFNNIEELLANGDDVLHGWCDDVVNISLHGKIHDDVTIYSICDIFQIDSLVSLEYLGTHGA